MATKVYGASDDLIEFEGDVRGEVGCHGTIETDARLVAFDDGTMLKVWYGDDGIWRIKVLNKGTLYDRFEPGTDPDADIYSDIVYFKDGLKRAFTGKQCAQVD